ncbi:MAG TPA: dTDP-4-dehydrorhamnose reductase [Candidatus Acidoferrales bacterium]|nr:dTDP-4-dehydrorhamnose reductase [Candidatus Acidoferrales bacterium]
MRALVTGANGLLGQKIVEVFKRESEYELLSCDLVGNNNDGQTLDITDHQKVMDVVGSYKPSLIINAAAFTNVDLAETEKETAYKINATAVGYLADAANVFNAKLVHISTDYVFDGKKGEYSEESLPEPISYYGKTKLAGENLVKSKLTDYAIIRTQVLYGFGRNVKKNFVIWVVEQLTRREKIRVVDDQVGNPTLADELAFAILKVCEKKATGLYHVSGFETISRYEFASKIADVFGLDFSLVKKVKSDELAQPAKRPQNSSFICLKAQTELGINMPPVSDSLYQMKQQMKLVQNGSLRDRHA